MPREFRLEDPGEGIHEAEILEVEVEEGERVEDGQVLLSVETDKAAVEVPSPFDGTVEEIRVETGQRVEVGEVLLTYTPEGAEGEEEPEEAGEEGPDEEGGREERSKPEAGEAGVGFEEAERGPGEASMAEVAGGAKGAAAAGEDDARPHPPDRPVPAAPATRRRARELGIDLHRVPGSGPGGRVTREDVEAFAEEGPPEPAPTGEGAERAAAPAAEPLAGREPPGAVELPDFSRWGEVERIPFRSVRRTTAERMARSWRRIPHVTHMDVADVTDLERVRRQHASEVEEAGGRLTLTVLVMKAAVSALKEHPRFNGSLDREAGEIVLKRYYHFGVAVDTDRGLLVPVMRDVDRKSVAELAVELTDLVERTRAGEVEPDEMRGATFTITNPGPIGGTAFSPIVDWPQVAILGMGRARLEPVMRGDLDDHELEARLRLPLCLGFDHRVNDGAGAARFVRHLRDTLADPDSFLLSV